MKKLLILFITALIMLLGLMAISAKAAMQPVWTQMLDCACEAMTQLKAAGFPQTGNGRIVSDPGATIPRVPGVEYDFYLPTNQEIDQWYTVLTSKPVVYEFVSPFYWKATVQGTSTNALGINPMGAKALLLPKLK